MKLLLLMVVGGYGWLQVGAIISSVDQFGITTTTRNQTVTVGVGITNSPNGALDVFLPGKTLVEAQVMSDSILPSGSVSSEVAEGVLKPVVNFVES